MLQMQTYNQSANSASSTAMTVPTQKLLTYNSNSSRKQVKPLRFSFPLNLITSHSEGVKTESLGELIVEGFGYYYPSRDEYGVDIDYTLLDNNNIKAALLHFGCMDEIESAALNHCINSFLSL